MNDGRHMQQAFGAQRAGCAMAEFGGQGPRHPKIVAGSEPVGCDQCSAFDIVQHVFQLRQAIRRVDVYQGRSGLRGGILCQNPLDPVRRSNPDTPGRL